MTVFKCKICGGALSLGGEQSVATCEYCGSVQTIPRLDNERRANLYDRANHFRRNNEFDKAMGIYEMILNEDGTDAEAYWSIVLCRYGIEYVEDPATHRRVPTVNRAQLTSVFDDEDYRAALRYADGARRAIYEAEAAAINELQKKILAISQGEEPFDVFLCYKESDANGKRTQESVLAAEVYQELTREGLRVFFSRITLEDKLGTAYEPYIFAALNSAQVMVVLGTRPEHLNAPWVKNEWGRYLAMIKNGARKTLIPAYRDMDPYDLPEEFSHLQAQDMSRLGFMQDLVRGIKKLLGAEAPRVAVGNTEPVTVADAASVEPLFRRAQMALKDGEYDRADYFYEQILNREPENAEAYVGKLLAQLKISNESALAEGSVSFEDSPNYKKALQFASEARRKTLTEALARVLDRREEQRRAAVYKRACAMLDGARDIPTCRNAQALFRSIAGYLDADARMQACAEKIDEFQAEWDRMRVAAREQREARMLAARRARKRVLTAAVSLILLVVISLSAYIGIFRVAIPLAHRREALDLVNDAEFDDAIALLEQAREEALFSGTVAKIEEAIETAKAAKALAQAADEAGKALEEAIGNANATIEASNYQKAVEDLLAAGVAVEIVYRPMGGRLPSGATAAESSVRYASGDAFDGIADCTRTGYRLVGWSCKERKYLHADQTFRLVLEADWSEKEYVIQYDLGGGSATNPTEYGVEDEAFTLNAPERVGYTFLGWTGTELSEPTVSVTVPSGSHGDRSYRANWRGNSYTATFDAAGGSCSEAGATYVYGSTATLPTPTRSGYTFKGWYNGATKLSGNTWSTASNVTLVAKWTPITYAVTYDLGGVPATNTNKTSYTVESVTFGFTDLTYPHCTFLGWYSDRDFTNKVTSVKKGSTGNITLYAKWDIQTFTIEYDWNGGTAVSASKRTYTVLDLPINLSSPLKSGHSFYYWAQADIDGEPIKQITTCGNYKLVANYLSSGVKISYYSNVDGYWFGAYYSGNATAIEIPKYHMKGDSITDCPYVKRVSFYNAPSVASISISDEVTEIRVTESMGIAQLQVYENGGYLKNRSNPYFMLIKQSDPDRPLRTIHEDTEFINTKVFTNNLMLTSIVIPENVRYIDSWAFFGCYNLIEVYNLSALDIRIGEIGNGNVAGCAKIVHSSLDEESVVENIALGDFNFLHDKQNDQYTLLQYTGDSLQVVMPSSINGYSYDIGNRCFQDANVISIVIPQGVTGCASEAFSGCQQVFEVYNLSEISFSINYLAQDAVIHTSMDEPSLITKQGDYYFYYNQTDAVYELVAYVGNDTVLVLPDSINGQSYWIAFCAFEQNPDIVSITIPKGVTQIDRNAFGTCSVLTDAYFEVTTGWVYAGHYACNSRTLADPKEAAKFLKKLQSTSALPMVRSEES